MCVFGWLSFANLPTKFLEQSCSAMSLSDFSRRARRRGSHTIIHEVAHIVTFKVFPNAKQNHGPEFKRVMRMLGADNPTRCHSYDVSGLKRYNTVKRFEYVCEAGCVHSLSVRRHNSIVNDGKRYRCAKHAVPIKFTGVVAEIKRG